MHTFSPPPLSIAQDAFQAGFGAHMVPLSRPDEPCLGVAPEQWGKAPALKGLNGWYPVDLRQQQCTVIDHAIHLDAMGANIGLACGRDAHLLAIDGDLDDVDLLTIFDTTREKHFPGSPTRRVADLAHHRMLLPVRVSESVRGTTLTWTRNVRTVKIDILSEGKQFAAWGVHPKTRALYVWSQPITHQIEGVYAFPEITLAQLDAFLDDLTQAFAFHGWVRASGGKVASTAASRRVVVRLATEEQLKQWLELLPNKDSDPQFDAYQAWSDLAHAVHAASGGSSWGRDLWIEWCAQRQQKPGAPETMWDSIKSTRNEGLDWVREMVRTRDPDAAAQLDFAQSDPIDQDLIDAMSEGSRTLWPLIRQNYGYIATDDRFIRLGTDTSYSRTGFDGKHAALNVQLKKEFGLKAKARIKTSDLILSQPDLINVDVRTYKPGDPLVTTDPDGKSAVNMWTTPKIPTIPVSATDVQPWLDHVAYVTGSKADADLLIKWFTLVVKYPHLKPNFHPLIIGRPGLGKDTMLVPIIRAVGERNYSGVDGNDLSRNWTTFLQRRLVCVSETKIGGQNSRSAHAIANELKKYLTCPPHSLEVEGKNVWKFKVANCLAWVFFTNEQSLPLYVGVGDRRFWIIDNYKTAVQSPAYYTALHDWLRDHPDHVANYLMSQTLTQAEIVMLQGMAPDTQAKQLLIQTNRPPLEVELETIIEDAQAGDGSIGMVTTIADLMTALRDRLPPNMRPSGQLIGSTLRALGGRAVRPDMNGKAMAVRLKNGKTARLLLLADKDANGRDYSQLSLPNYAKAYEDGRWPVALTIVKNEPEEADIV